MTVPVLKNGQAMLLRIFVGESDRWHHMELYEALVMEAWKVNLAGATVLKGVLSYGLHRQFHVLKLVDLAADLPVIVEIVDSEAQVRSFLSQIDEMLSSSGCLVTLEKIEIYRHLPQQSSADQELKGQL